MLNTNEFVKAWQELEKAKNPDLDWYLQISPYPYLVGFLTASIEKKVSEKKIQKHLDELTQELKQKLSDLTDSINLNK